VKKAVDAPVIFMARDPNQLNPVESWRRKEKQRVALERRTKRHERLANVPAHKLDVRPLVAEIHRLSVLEYEGKLNSDARLRKKHLSDRYQSICKARRDAGLDTESLIDFDPEAYEAAKLEKLQKKRHKPEPSAPKDDSPFDDRGFPRLPNGPAPSKEELEALGLPAFLHNVDLLEYVNGPSNEDGEAVEVVETVEESGTEAVADVSTEDDAEDDLEAALEREYAVFKESLCE
jgi:hypothetical protein